MHASTFAIGGRVKAWRLTCAGVILLAVSAVTAARTADAEIKVEPAKLGIEALHFNGWQFIEQRSFYNGDLGVKAVKLTRDNGETFKANTKAVNVTTRDPDPRHHVTAINYEWGTLEADYQWQDNRLDLRLTVKNATEHAMNRLAVNLTSVRFPSIPKGMESGGTVRMDPNIGGPSITAADFEDGLFLLCNERMGDPLITGFRHSTGNRKGYLLRLDMGPNGWLSPHIDNKVQRTIPAGATEHFHLSMRFGGPDATVESLTGDLFQRYREKYPYRLEWEDRRPIGQVFLSSAAKRFHSETNPQGWFRDPELDVTTDKGRAEFRQRLMDFADGLISSSKQMGSQGVIIWDIEGQEMPHATSYIGDPRALPRIAPMMDAVADEFFAKLNDAGLRTGITIRPQVITHKPDGKQEWVQRKADDPAATLIDKIRYARQRWNCELFYIDSNGNPNAPMHTDVFRKVAKAHPDVLLLPESHWTDYHAFTMPYDSRPAPQHVRRLYPKAVRAISFGQYRNAPRGERRQQLVTAAKRGAIFFLFPQWRGRSLNDWALNILAEAGRRQSAPTDAD